MNVIFMASFVIVPVIFIILLIHCLRNEQMYRPFNLPASIIKAVWIILFCSLYLRFAVAYLVWGICIRHRDFRANTWHAVHSILMGIFVLSALPIPFTAGLATQPVTYEKVQNGEDIEKKNVSNRESGYYLGAIQSQSSTNSSSTVSAPNNGRFSAGYVVIILESSEPLAVKTGELLLEEIKKLPFVKEIVMVSSENQIQKFEELPDCWIRISAANIKRFSVGPRVNLSGTVTLAASSKPYYSGNSYTESFSPPTIDYQYHAETALNCEYIILGSSNNYYLQPAKEIVKEFAKGLSEFLLKLRVENGVYPDELDELIPDKEYPYITPLDYMNTTPPLLAGSALLIDSYRVWKQTVASGELEAWINPVKEQLGKNGWVTQSENDVQSSNLYFRFSKDMQRIEIYLRRQGGGFSVDAVNSPTKDLIITWTVYKPKEKVNEYLKTVLPDASLDFLLMMKYWYYNDALLRPEFIARLKENKSQSPEILLELARHWEGEKNATEQWKSLKKAEYIYQALGKSDRLNTIKETWEKFNETNPGFEPPIALDELLSSLNFILLSGEPQQQIKKTVGLNEPVVFYRWQDNGLLQTISATMIPSKTGTENSEFLLQVCIFGVNGGSSSATGSSSVPGQLRHWAVGAGEQRYAADSQAKLTGENQFEIELTVKKKL